MMARRGVMGLLAGAATLVLGGCGILEQDATYRFRMTIEVETPEGTRTGSSVYEVSAGNRISITPEMADRQWSVRGEAAAVDLPGGRTLFALLKTHAHFEDMLGLSMASLHPDFPSTGYDVVGVAKEFASGDHAGPAKVAEENYPMLVMFRNEDDPASVELVELGDLGIHFGPGVSLRGVTVEVTDDPVTVGIEERLGWLRTHRGTLKPNPPRLMKDATPIQLIGPSVFSTELYQ